MNIANLLRGYTESTSLGGNHPTMVVVPRSELAKLLDVIPALQTIAVLPCQDFNPGDAECDGTGLWCPPCLAKAACNSIGFDYTGYRLGGSAVDCIAPSNIRVVACPERHDGDKKCRRCNGTRVIYVRKQRA